MIDFRVFYLEKNEGHGNARRKGFSECRNEIVALMDSDDICVPTRFEKQLTFFETNPKLSIVGGQIAEFIGEVDNVVGIRQVPSQDAEIKEYMKKRCPMNQMTVMFRKKELERVGGYIDWYCEEDYYLWVRMALKRCLFANLPDILVKVRVGNEMSARRGGMKYFKSEARLQKFMLNNHIISVGQYLYNVAIRFAGEVLAPNWLRTKLFVLFRKTPKQEVCVYQNDNEEIMKEDYMPFSVAMCVYGGDKAEWFDEALASVVNQTLKPQEIVLVVDGPIPDAIQDVIDKYSDICIQTQE